MDSHEVRSIFVSLAVFLCLPEQFTAVGVILVIDCFLQNTAQMKRQPAESENQYQAENCLCHLPPLKERKMLSLMRFHLL